MNIFSLAADEGVVLCMGFLGEWGWEVTGGEGVEEIGRGTREGLFSFPVFSVRSGSFFSKLLVYTVKGSTEEGFTEERSSCMKGCHDRSYFVLSIITNMFFLYSSLDIIKRENLFLFYHMRIPLCSLETAKT